MNVSISDRNVLTTFVVLSLDQDNHTLLGADFLREAGIVLDLGQHKWHFQDSPNNPMVFAGKPPRDPGPTCFDSLELRSDEATILDQQQRKQLGDLLCTNEETFALGGAPTTQAEHCIIVPENQRPIASPPYRLSPSKKDLLQKEIKKRIAENTIEECESPWAAPVAMVPKPNEDMRLCIDYRRLNEVTISDKYPMPRIEDLLHAAKNTKFMTTLDLRSGYYQVQVRECDREKTAFITPTGMYRFSKGCRSALRMRRPPFKG